jgi:hypothetical protein
MVDPCEFDSNLLRDHQSQCQVLELLDHENSPHHIHGNQSNQYLALRETSSVRQVAQQRLQLAGDARQLKARLNSFPKD